MGGISGSVVHVTFVYASILSGLRCLKYLVQHGCEVNYLDNLGFWAAYYAARYNRLECLRYLVEQGTSVTCSQKDNKTLLHVVITRVFCFYLIFCGDNLWRQLFIDYLLPGHTHTHTHNKWNNTYLN